MTEKNYLPQPDIAIINLSKSTKIFGRKSAKPEQDFERWGVVIDQVKKEFWTPMSLNTSGQVTDYEMLLNGVTIGYLQFMTKTFTRQDTGQKISRKLEVESAFGIETSANSIQITDLSIDHKKILWALNLALFSADNFFKIEEEIEKGIFIYVSSLMSSIIENPSTMFSGDVSNILFIIHHSWTKKMVDIGLIDSSNLIDIPLEGQYYGLPIEYLRLINFNSTQIKESKVKLNYWRNNQQK